MPKCIDEFDLEVELEELIDEELMNKILNIRKIEYDMTDIFLIGEIKNDPQGWMKHYKSYIDSPEIVKAIKLLKDNRYSPGYEFCYNKYKIMLKIWGKLCEIYRLCIMVVEGEINFAPNANIGPR